MTHVHGLNRFPLPAVQNAIKNVLFGDPALIIRTNTETSAFVTKNVSKNDLEIQKHFNSYTEILITNPIIDIGSIELCIDKPENVSIEMYDISGRKVISVYEGILESGKNVLNFDVSNISQGIYLMNFNIGGKNIIKRVVIMK